MGELFDFLSSIIDSGAEVHIVDMTNPKEPVEHVYKPKMDCCGGCGSALDKDEVPFVDDSCPYDGDCAECPYEEACAEDLGIESLNSYEEDDPPFWGIPDVRRIVFSGPATIVFWEDNTKTIVKCMEGEKFERYAGFAAACMKKMFGSTSRAKSIMEEYAVEQVKVKKEKKNDVLIGKRAKTCVVDENPGVSVDHETIMEAVNEALNG